MTKPLQRLKEYERLYIGNYFGTECYGIKSPCWDFDFLDQVALVVYYFNVEDAKNSEYLDDFITEHIYNIISRDCDEWTILKHYCSYDTANWEEAEEDFLIDCTNIIDYLFKEDLKESEDEEEDA